MTPLWVVNGLLLLLPTLVFAIVLAKRRRAARELAYEANPHCDAHEAGAALALACCTVAPVIVFEVLVCAAATADVVPYWAAFLPLLLWLLIACVILSAYAMSRRPIRPRPVDGMA